MEYWLEKGIQRCFPDYGSLHEIIRRELFNRLNFENQPKVDSLAYLAIKSRMHKVLITDEADVKLKFVYKFLNNEPHYVDWPNFCKILHQQPIESDENEIVQDVQSVHSLPMLSPRRIMASIVKKFRNFFQCVSNPDVHEEQPIREDDSTQKLLGGSSIYFILSRELPRLYEGRVDIIVNRNTLQICFDKKCIANIPHRNGVEYNVFWAEQFTRMVLSKSIKLFMLQMDGEGILDSDYMGDFLNENIINKLPRVIPPEGWRYDMRRQIYLKTCGRMESKTNYSVAFFRCDDYVEFMEEYVWGYVENY